jgi:hypothetical protein
MPVVRYVGARVGAEPLRTASGTLRYFNTGQDGNIITAARKLYGEYFSPLQTGHSTGPQNGIDVYLRKAPAENPAVQYQFRVWIDTDGSYRADPIGQAGGKRRYSRAK